MRRLWKRPDELEVRLRQHRPEPRADFLDTVVARLARRQLVGRTQLAFASALTFAALVVLAAFGGIGYASSAAKSLAHAIGTNQTNSHAAGKGNNGGSNSSGSALNAQSNRSGPSSSNDQYEGKTTICHKTHSQTNPWVVITVSNNALPAHKAHGDTLVNANPPPDCPGPPIP